MAEPMYRQIAEDLRQQIEAGELAPGTQLRTELELREKYDASRNTVRDAIKWLISRGLVETRPGQGTFVVDEMIPFITTLTGEPRTASGGEGNTYLREVTAQFRRPKDTLPRVEIQTAEYSPELKLPADTSVVSRHQQRYIDDTPWSLQTSFYPMNFVEDGAIRLLQASNIDEGTVGYLESALGIKQVGWRDTITVRVPDEVEVAFFKLPDDGRVSVIETRRTAFSEKGTPVRLTVSVYPADRNQFAVIVGQAPADVMEPPASGTNA
jgi:GntR family transcriptional regulator